MPLLESLIGLTQGAGRRLQAGEKSDEKRPLADSSLTGGDDRWTPSGTNARTSAMVAGSEGLRLGREIAEERKVCGNPACRNGWASFWKGRESPIFEGRWACCRGCATVMARTALARETGEWPEDEGPVEHRHRIPLGLVLLAHGWVTHPKLQRALEAQRANGFGRIGEWLVSECGLSQEQVTRGLSAQWNCPVLTLDGFSPQTMAMALPRVLIEAYGALPLRVAGGRVLYVGFQDRLDAAASFAIGQMTGLKTESGILGETAFRRAKERLLESRFPAVSVVEEADRDALAESVAATIERTRPVASKLLKLHRYYWLRVWKSAGACQPGSALPAGVDGVSDYLFTIERHAVPAFGRNDDAAQPIRPVVATAVAEPVGGLAEQLSAELESVLRGDQDAVVQGEPAEELAPDSADLKSTERNEAALAVVERQAMSEEVETERPLALSRQSDWKDTTTDWKDTATDWKDTATVQAVARIEPIDGEYLPGVESGDVMLPKLEATGFLSLHRRPGWNPLQLWSRKSL